MKIPKKLYEWKSKIKNIDFDTSEGDKALRNLGFKKACRRYSTCRYIWINHKYRLVLKSPYICGDRPKIGLPMLKVKRNHRSPFNGYGYYSWWVLQPLCNRKGITERKVSELEDKYYNLQDLKTDNLGYYRNKLVLIDW